MIGRWVSMGRQVKLLKIFHHLAVIALGLTVEWTAPWLLLSLASYLLISRLGTDAGLHRYFSHRSYKLSKFWERLLLVLGSLDGRGSSITFVGTHLLHHIKSDQAGDPHSPQILTPRQVWFTFWPAFHFPKSYIHSLIKDPWHRTIHRYYPEFNLLFLAVLALMGPQALLFGWCLPQVFAVHMTGAVNVLCHSKTFGYRNFETPDHSSNNTWINWLTLGGGLHNNHHHDSMNPNTAIRRWEFDGTWWFIRLIRSQ